MLERPLLQLPAGMRDFAPEAAATRRHIAGALLQVFERWGYARVITPAFEYEEVLALGLGAAGRDAAIRFVEPSSGRVVALRPDITPQIARLIATRFRDEPGPVRLCYEGTVVRFDRRARSQRELIQAGVELAGVTSPVGDAEMIALGAEALAALGLRQPTIDLGHLGLTREVLDALHLPEEARSTARDRIAKRDRGGLREVLRAAKGPKAVVDFALALPELAGPSSTVTEALRRAPTAGIRRALRSLNEVLSELARHELPARLQVDLGEVRGFDYYTGVRVLGYVEGAPDAVLQGGRYDNLVERYGRRCPAVGCAVDVELAALACESQGLDPSVTQTGETGGVLVVGPSRQAWQAAAALRAKGRRAVAYSGDLEGAALESYARRWQFAELIHTDGRRTAIASKGHAARTRRAPCPS
jgi:ATP phosphoribosyltransferase regulatory subunit